MTVPPHAALNDPTPEELAHARLVRLDEEHGLYPDQQLTPEEAAVLALRDINAAWASWTSGRLGEEDAMTTILTALTFARENGALQ